MNKEILQEKSIRYGRLFKNEDFTKTIKELREEFKIDGSVFLSLNSPHANEYLFAREGIRTFLNKLNNLENEVNEALKYEEEKGDNDNE